MKTLVVIPARGGSKRIPKKNIKEFYEKPIIFYSLTAAFEAQIFNKIHVSTDDSEIYAVATSLGFEPEFYRSVQTSGDSAPVRDVLKECLQEFDSRGIFFDIICLLSATAPLIEAADLRKAFDLFQNFPMEHPLLAVSRYPVPIEWALRYDDGKKLLEPVNNTLFFSSSHDFQDTYYDIGSFAFFSRHTLITSSHEIKFLPYIMPQIKSIDIDNIDDWKMAEELYKIRLYNRM